MLQPIKVLWQCIKNENFNQILIIGKKNPHFSLGPLVSSDDKSKIYFYLVYFYFDFLFISFWFYLMFFSTQKQINKQINK